MPCFYPLKGYKSRFVSPEGKQKIIFGPPDGFVDITQPVSVPCGQCIGCRLEYSRQWAMRCVHESTLYENNQFITLTYDSSHVPQDASLSKRELQLFFKRLRKSFGEGVRYFACGEYGEKSLRPHYHACVFNLDLPDRVKIRDSSSGGLYYSALLEKIWGKGMCTTGDVTFESAAYVARYVTKKIKGKALEEVNDRGLLPYERWDSETGEFWRVEPEFVLMSRGSKKLKTGGIGKGWFEKWSSDCYPSDSVVFRGKEMTPPKYYDGLMEKHDETLIKELKEKRKAKAFKHEKEVMPERLEARDRAKRKQAQFYSRDID